MVGIIIITHHGLAESYLTVLNHIYGSTQNIAAISIEPDEAIDLVEVKFQQAMNKMMGIDELLLLTDLFGATPANFTTKIASHRLSIEYKIISGINLNMLVTAFANQQLPLFELVKKIIKNGKQGIVIVSTHHDSA